MHLLICAGGTGGGVYPALAVLQQILKAENTLGDDADFKSLEGTDQGVMIPNGGVLWIGGFGGMEADLVKRLGLAFEAIPAAGVHGVGLAALPGNLMQLAQGFRQVRQIIRRFKPDVMFFTGGFIAVPVALAGWLPRRNSPRPRSLLYVPDIEPGLALKTLARLADRIAVTVDETRKYLPRRKQIYVTGYPVRADLLAWDRGPLGACW